MMGWSVMCTGFLFAHQADNGGAASYGALASFWLQQLYIAKFFLWEKGYMASIDIAHDRLGFYIGWGCLVWVPSLYTSGMYHLYVNSVPGKVDMPGWLAWGLVAAGIVCIVVTYLADEQRQQVRREDARVNVWGRKPRVIRAKYVSADGTTHNSILLACGWWSIARHFHYVTEWAGALLWTLPCAWVPGAGLLAWTYPIFLGILLFHRSVRDEERCSEKYGKYWKQYSAIVPYRVIPGIY
jgi:7-dehydrocholesterol reductase